ncbi:MAG: tetratricopeptide repeat protein, partial [Ignavibacteriae bacterium]|nr:tetratricopeptide repeat protein [Ignavibacteriota bacterium]
MRGFHVAFGVVLLVLLSVSASAQNTKENADFKLAINLYNDGLFDLAAEQLRQFIASYPTSGQTVEARFYLGLTQLKLKRFEDARLTFQTFALTYQDNPKAPEAWWNVGESYAAVKNFKEAALAFERVKVFHPKSKTAPLALVEASKHFSLAGETDNARRVLRIVVQEYATSNAVLAARTQLGKIYFEEGQLDLAQSELKRVVDGDPSAEARGQAMLTLGSIYQATGKSEQAHALYQEILKKHKTGLVVDGAYLNLGKLEASSGKYLEAIARFKKVIDAKTDTSLAQEALIETGDAYASLRDYPNTVAFYEKYIDMYPHNSRVPELLWKSAIANGKGKNFRKSNDACNRLLKSQAASPLKRRAMLKLARNAEEQKVPSQAVQFYAAFLEQFSDDPSTDAVLFRVATVHERDLHDLRKAAAYYELLATRFPRSRLVDDAYFQAAGCYEQLKEFDRALQLCRHIVEALPSSEFRTAAEEKIFRITTFEVKDKDAGLEKLALLIGDVVAERDKVGLAFKLGEIYFNDLKNYSAAAMQFSNAVNSGMTDQRFVDALYLRAKSYEILALNDEKYRPQAIESYRIFLQSYPGEPRIEDAVVALFELS